MSEKYVVTWDMLQIHARKLASRLMPSEQWKGIIAVSRGGLVPGALLARELGIRHVDTVCISSYDHDNQRELKVLKRAEGDGEGFIVIDDLVDTGGTAVAIRDITFVVLVGGSSLDFEIPQMITDALAQYGVVAGQGNIRGTEGPRNAVATGLVLAGEAKK